MNINILERYLGATAKFLLKISWVPGVIERSVGPDFLLKIKLISVCCCQRGLSIFYFPGIFILHWPPERLLLKLSIHNYQ